MEEKLEIMAKCEVCRLALTDGKQPYIVPMSFGFACEEGELSLYFHCAHQGRKLDMLRQNPRACFEMDCAHRLVEGDITCRYSMEFESIVGSGELAIVAEPPAKEKALRLLMKKYAPAREFSFSDEQLKAVTVLKLTVQECSGKRLKK